MRPRPRTWTLNTMILGRVAAPLLHAADKLAGRAALGAVDAALAWPVTEEALGRVLESPLMERLADRLLAAGIADAAAARLLEGPELERIVVTAMDSAGAQRMVGLVIESKLVDETVARLLASKDLWLVVDEIARSPSVREAISHQGVGFAEELAGAVRTRSQSADDRVERLAHRLFRRDRHNGRNA